MLECRARERERERKRREGEEQRGKGRNREILIFSRSTFVNVEKSFPTSSRDRILCRLFKIFIRENRASTESPYCHARAFRSLTWLHGSIELSYVSYSFGNDVYARAHIGPVNFNRYTYAFVVSSFGTSTLEILFAYRSRLIFLALFEILKIKYTYIYIAKKEWEVRLNDDSFRE